MEGPSIRSLDSPIIKNDKDVQDIPFDKKYLSDMVANKDLGSLKKLNNTKGLLSFLRVDKKMGLVTTSVEDASDNQWKGNYNDKESVIIPSKSDFKKKEVNKNDPEELSWLQDFELTKETFPQRVDAFGVNVYPAAKSKTFMNHVLEVLNDKMLLLLCFAAVISLGLGIYQDVRVSGVAEEDDNNVHWVEGFSIIVAIFVVVMVSASNDYKKDKQFKKLNEKKKDRYIQVIRDGIRKNISVYCIMVGDIMLVENGEVLCADAVLISSSNLKVDESSITGEGLARQKYSVEEHYTKNKEAIQKWIQFKKKAKKGKIGVKRDTLDKELSNSLDDKTENEDAQSPELGSDLPPSNLIESDPFLISGSLVLEGIGECVVVSVGENAFYGKTLMSLSEGNEATPLQIKLNNLAELIAKIGGGIAAVMFVALIIQYVVYIAKKEVSTKTTSVVSNIVGIFISVITVIVVAIPEGLPLAVTLSLAIATVRMLKDNCMVRVLAACETMGNATTICSDKTGTLTQNKMSVVTGTVGTSHSFRTYPAGTAQVMKRTATAMPNDDFVTDAEGNAIPKELAEINKPRSDIYDKEALLDKTGDIGDLIEESKFSNNEVTSKIEERENDIHRFRKITPKSLINLIFDSIALNSTAFVVEEAQDEDLVFTEPKKGFLSKLFSSGKKSKSSDSINEKRNPLEGTGSIKIDEFSGSSTETALLQWTQSIGEKNILDRRENNSDSVTEMWPFNSAKKFMSVLVNLGKNDSGENMFRLYVKGAPETMLYECSYVVDVAKFKEYDEVDEEIGTKYDGKLYKKLPTKVLSEKVNKSILETISDYSSRALRTIGLMYCDITESDLKKVDTEESENIWHLNNNLVWMGVFGIEDPLREGVANSVRKCQNAGIMVRMVTGDNLITAKAIATQCGIYTPGMGGIVMEGKHFRNLHPEEMNVIIPRLQVLARSSPNDKMLLVNWLKEHGNVVSATGDGTNDGPALKAADVGFSMGISGTEIAKEASDIILIDDNFNSIVRALIWGRSVNDSMKKFLQFQLTVNVTAVIVAFVSALQGKSQDPVFSPIQLLWVNLIMDTFAAIALATDPPQESLLNRYPERPNSPIITLTMWKHIIGQSIFQIIVTFITLYGSYNVFGLSLYVQSEYLVLRSIVFNVFVFMQVFNEFNCRVLGSEVNCFKGLSKNKYFMCVILGTMAAQILIIEVGGSVFQTKSLSAGQWAFCVGVGLISLPLGLILRLFPTWIIAKVLMIPNRSAYEEPVELDWQPPAQTVQRQLAFMHTLRGGRLDSSNIMGMKVNYDKLRPRRNKMSESISGMSKRELEMRQREAVSRVISELPSGKSELKDSKNKNKRLEALSKYKPSEALKSIGKDGVKSEDESNKNSSSNDESNQFKMSKLASKFKWNKKSKHQKAGFSFAAAMVPTMVVSSIGAGMSASTKPKGDDISKIIVKALDEKSQKSRENSPSAKSVKSRESSPDESN
ncbi:Calcium-transporting ATPase PAT1 [Smittium mucronatum]|uniref:Calcium-transporting ATPase n=1 Tax=Smittium mucronatum TaxID=133383 RepID=A0A1R0H6M1_9FUNG|nr:Calcium-transporting ATPase PAT1 [Smittium mucronatum]